MRGDYSSAHQADFCFFHSFHQICVISQATQTRSCSSHFHYLLTIFYSAARTCSHYCFSAGSLVTHTFDDSMPVHMLLVQALESWCPVTVWERCRPIVPSCVCSACYYFPRVDCSCSEAPSKLNVSCHQHRDRVRQWSYLLALLLEAHSICGFCLCSFWSAASLVLLQVGQVTRHHILPTLFEKTPWA